MNYYRELFFNKRNYALLVCVLLLCLHTTNRGFSEATIELISQHQKSFDALKPLIARISYSKSERYIGRNIETTQTWRGPRYALDAFQNHRRLHFDLNLKLAVLSAEFGLIAGIIGACVGKLFNIPNAYHEESISNKGKISNFDKTIAFSTIGALLTVIQENNKVDKPIPYFHKNLSLAKNKFSIMNSSSLVRLLLMVVISNVSYAATGHLLDKISRYIDGLDKIPSREMRDASLQATLMKI